jgi:quercetin dioxygenase-like cupin family protein
MLKATFNKMNATSPGDEAIHPHALFTPEQVGANLQHGWAFLKPGQEGPPHRSSGAELWVVYGGRGELRVGGAATPLNELDTVLLPPDAERSLANRADADLTFFWARWKPVAPVGVGAECVGRASFDRARLKPAHLDTFYYWEPFSTKTLGGPDRFTTGWGLVGGGVASELHKHPTAELYVFFRGATVQQVGLECAAVQAGDAVMVPADTLHNLLNYTDREVLLYWIEVIPGSLPAT